MKSAESDVIFKDLTQASASAVANSLTVIQAVVEPSLATAKADDKFQFDRHGYFVADRVDHAAGKLVFNFAVGLKDGWGKE